MIPLVWDTGNLRKSAKLDLLAAEFHIFELESEKVEDFRACQFAWRMCRREVEQGFKNSLN